MDETKLLTEIVNKYGAKRISQETGVGLATIYRWLQPDSRVPGGSRNPLKWVTALIRCTKDLRVTEWMCMQQGGFFVANPKVIEHPQQPAVSCHNRIVAGLADMLKLIIEAAEDGRITAEEVESIRREWESLKSITEGFERDCERQDFEAVRQRITTREPL